MSRYVLFHGALALCAATITLAVAVPPPASAATTCSGQLQGNYLAGMDDTGEQFYGVRATITLHSPALCPTSDPELTRISIATVMMASGGSELSYAQVGYGKYQSFPGDPSSGMQWNSEWDMDRTAAPAAVDKFYGVPDTTRDYWVARDWGNGSLAMIVNGVTILDETPFDPYSGVWQTPIHPEVFAETNYCTTDIVGTSGSPASFGGPIEGETGVDTWAGANASVFSPSCAPRYHVQQTGYSSFNTWTDPLN